MIQPFFVPLNFINAELVHALFIFNLAIMPW